MANVPSSTWKATLSQAPALGDSGKAVAAEFVAGPDLGGHLPFKSCGLAWFRPEPGLGRALPALWRPCPAP
jgi:hypothetical protein